MSRLFGKQIDQMGKGLFHRKGVFHNSLASGELTKDSQGQEEMCSHSSVKQPWQHKTHTAGIPPMAAAELAVKEIPLQKHHHIHWYL